MRIWCVYEYKYNFKIDRKETSSVSSHLSSDYRDRN